jgi:hypothetical protein
VQNTGPPVVDGGACPLSHEPSGIFMLAGVASADMAQNWTFFPRPLFPHPGRTQRDETPRVDVGRGIPAERLGGLLWPRRVRELQRKQRAG